MFVLLFGLMGVAAIFPVGNHYAGKGDQYDRGAALAGSAFAELKARGLMRPGNWMYSDGTAVMTDPFIGNFTNGNDAGHAFVIDAIGAANANGDLLANTFPYDGPNPGWTLTPTTSQWPIRRVTVAPIPGGAMMGPQVASSIFRLRDDVSVAHPQENDRPGILRWATSDTQPDGTPNNTPDYAGDDRPLARDYTGSYSWLATVLPVDANALAALQPSDPRHSDSLYEVSVAVFYKREDEPSAASERLLTAELGPGGDLELIGADVGEVDDASQDIRPGQWIALCGVHPTTGKFVLQWYRLLSLDDETTEQGHGNHAAEPHRDAMVEGPDWPQIKIDKDAGVPVTNLRAILIPNVIGVATQTVKLETE